VLTVGPEMDGVIPPVFVTVYSRLSLTPKQEMMGSTAGRPNKATLRKTITSERVVTAGLSFRGTCGRVHRIFPRGRLHPLLVQKILKNQNCFGHVF